MAIAPLIFVCLLCLSHVIISMIIIIPTKRVHVFGVLRFVIAFLCLSLVCF